jgi:muramoyltetrapeptide carboxypeptidase
MLKPRALRPGDRIGIVAPSSPFERAAFDRGIEELRLMGFEPVFDDRVFSRGGYVSGDAAARAAAFLEVWQDPSIGGVVAARGGYGSVQVLPFLDPDIVRATPKALIGYSDVTSLLTFISCRCNLVCFHGPHVAGGLAHQDNGYDRSSFVAALMSAAPMGALPADGVEALVRGEAVGPVFGGNLTVLAASLGTPFAFDPPAGHVLFLDEIGERPYRLDRLLTQFRLAGLLSRAAAIVFGQLPGCDEPGAGPTARDTVAALVRDFPGPVLFGFRSGHTRGPGLTLPFGVRARVVARESLSFVIEEGAVE